MTQSGSIQGSFENLMVGEERYVTSHLSAATPPLKTGTCILGPCVVSTGGNVTRLQWEDLKLTLTFAWEVHVFGSIPLLLWAQATLALFALREETSAQQLSVTGGLATLHCISLLSALPRWSAPKSLENGVRKWYCCCAPSLGCSPALCKSSFLWLYGLLGDWRRFGWGWWFGQLSARLFELACSFSLLLLGSRVFWRPQGSKQTAKRGGKGKHRNKLLDIGYKWGIGGARIRTGLNCCQITGKVTGSRVQMSASLSASRGVEWQEHECIHSLIEFDLHPPSPINLHHSIDNALHHAHLLGVGNLFSPSSPSWTQNEGSGGPLFKNVVSPTTPASKAYRVVSENTVHFGKLLIGAQGVVSDKEMEISGLRSAEQSDEYRSNEEERFQLAKAKLRRLGPFVQCGSDSMTLRIPGQIRMPPFLVDRGVESPVPLSEMPASCGFSLKRACRDVSLDAPYQGCHVRQQGGHYILPLFIMGSPVQMSCPVSPPLPKVSCLPSGMIISLAVRADNVKVQVDGSWQPLLLAYSKCSFTLEIVDGSLVITAPFTGSCWEMKLLLMYGDREVTLSCPVTQPTLAPTTIYPVQDPTDSQQMFYPFPIGKPWGYPPYFHGRPGLRPVPPTVPPTMTTTTLQDPNQQMFHQMDRMSMFHPYYFNSRGYPAAPQLQKPRYPMSHHPHQYHFERPVEATTTPSTTTAAQFDQFAAPQRQPFRYPMPHHPHHPQFYGPQPFVPPGVWSDSLQDSAPYHPRSQVMLRFWPEIVIKAQFGVVDPGSTCPQPLRRMVPAVEAPLASPPQGTYPIRS
ncbi:unnamed protein product [Leuciscus chuanchicus]